MATTKTTTKKKNIEDLSRFVISEGPTEIDPNMIIPVINGFNGKLVYVSPRSGEIFEWETFGDVQEMELKELRNVKSSAKGFFQRNYFMFDEEYSWVVSYLGLTKYYENALSIEGLDAIMKATPSVIRKTVPDLSEGQKRSLVYKVRAAVNTGDIDSLKSIEAFEDSLGVSLMER